MNVKVRAGKKCPVPFARDSPTGCFAQKVPDAFFPLTLAFAIASVSLLVLLAGCGAEGPMNRVSSSSSKPAAEGEDASGVSGFLPAEDETAETASQETSSDADRMTRKLIYTADVDVVVEDFDPLPAKIEAMVRQYDGFIAESNVRGTRGDRRRGTWKVRIPVDQFEPFLSTASTIGEVRSRARRSQDVTEEYFDVEARIRNKKVQEEGLLKILEDRTGELEDVLAVERELSRVREEVERMQGRLRVLENLTSLTTVNIQVEEIRDYVPPQAPTFSRRVSRSLEGSLTVLRQAGEALVIAAVALAPWAIVFAIPAIPIAWFIRRQLRGSTISDGERGA